jgi:predicted AAA+ superfamily ATPase
VEGIPFIDRLASGAALSIPDDTPDLPGYVELALRGGFPDPALGLSEPTRRRWLESYVDQLVTRDVPHAEGARDPARLQRYLEAHALNSAGTAADATIYQAAGINQRTATAYGRALANLFVVEAVPAWTTNRLKRLMSGPKRYVLDPALLGAVLRIDTAAVLRDGNLLGRVIDTFIASQLRAEIAVAATRPRLYHLRDMNGRREVDVLAELSGQRVVAFEAKAAAAPGSKEASHLVWLREQLGARFVAGVVFHAGPRIYGLGDRIVAAPICALWG